MSEDRLTEVLNWTFGGDRASVVDVSVDVLPEPEPEPGTSGVFWRLTWSDGVTNVWSENFADPATLFLRLGVLLRGAQTDRLFRHPTPVSSLVVSAPDGPDAPLRFVLDAARFLDEQLET